MTHKEAWKELTARPLVFGDQRQIDAHKLLLKMLDEKEEVLGYAVEFPTDFNGEFGICPTCHGDGVYECDECGSEVDCKDCDGTGEVEPELVTVAA